MSDGEKRNSMQRRKKKSSFVHARNKSMMPVCEKCAPVRAQMSMNNALAVGVVIYNASGMFACELRHMLKGS